MRIASGPGFVRHWLPRTQSAFWKTFLLTRLFEIDSRVDGEAGVSRGNRYGAQAGIT